ncbi:hypothetical protein POJ06DRAFT_249254 [Lipomyces tetrasporus]|uniref:F-box domain-containing protein n=1 Tax=Lipomyces tetrasporus TaxID=54092 RepID=A0AAD7VUX6_9ASCO|nr:uncharacterized protein POJ06DRAFT_249254 [Lipomyces tetrasporus]KAJ8102279.1 hypothetical protein POJ06DRAFT_249254 [Lipomyces tetrasporus]
MNNLPSCEHPRPADLVGGPDRLMTALKDHASRIDPVKYLPPEVFEKILEYVSYPLVCSLLSVSKSWYFAVSEFVDNNPATYKYLDFRRYDLDRVTPDLLLSCIHKSRGLTTSVLYPCHSTKNAHYGTLRAMIFLHETLLDKSYLRLKNMVINQRLRLLTETPSTAIGTTYQKALIGAATANLWSLRGLAIDNLYFVIRQWSESGINDTTALDRLEELHISAHAIPMLFAFIRTKRSEPLFPNLRILICGSDYEARRRLEVPHWLYGAPKSESLIAFPELLEFRIGGIPKGHEREQDLDQYCLDIIPTWMPKLEVLTCKGVNIRPSRYPRRDFVHRVDMRRSRNLVELDFSYTKMWIVPFIPPTCRRLVLRGAGFGAVDLSNSMLNGPDLGPAADAVSAHGLEKIHEQYKGIEVLDMSSCGAVLTNNLLIGLLTLCNKDKLTTLILQSCLRLEFGKYLSELMEHIVLLCPNLRCLKLSKNSSVSDGDVAAIADLPYLEYLDLSGTSVTDNGLREFLNLKKSNLKTLVAVGSPDVTENGLRWIREMDIGTVPPTRSIRPEEDWV